MPKYQVICKCDNCISVDADSVEEAKVKLRQEMTPTTVAAHCYDRHGDQSAMTKEEIDALIETDTQEVTE